MAYVDNLPTATELPFQSRGKHHQVSIDVDFSVTGNSLAQNDLMGLLAIPAGMDVVSAKIKVTTANAAVTNVDLGLTADDGTPATAADLIDGATLGTTGYKSGAGTRVQTTADMLVVLTNLDADTLSAGVIEVKLDLVDMR